MLYSGLQVFLDEFSSCRLFFPTCVDFSGSYPLKDKVYPPPISNDRQRQSAMTCNETCIDAAKFEVHESPMFKGKGLTTTYCIELNDENDTLKCGRQLAHALEASGEKLAVVYLSGDLGAGKTTMTRGILAGMGYHGKVKSPTYTLVEDYKLDVCTVYHFDLYRLGDPEELEFMGIRDFFSLEGSEGKKIVCVVEWPERGGAILPKPDVDLVLSVQGSGRLARIEVINPKLEADW